MEDFANEEMASARRFEIATEPAARNRLDAFRGGIKAFQKKHPEVLGATVYGSMIKGDTARATSDVDSFLYIDADAIADKTKLENQRLLEDEYRSELLNDLGITEEEKELYRDVIPKILSNEVLDNNIQANIQYENDYKALREMRRNKDTSVMSEEEIDQMYSQEPHNNATDNFEIAGMFHARVGSGIEKYRKLFLQKLVALSDREIAETIWRGVYAQIETMEAGGKKRKVPSTLEEALQTYHPELYRSITQQKDSEKIKELKDKIDLMY